MYKIKIILKSGGIVEVPENYHSFEELKEKGLKPINERGVYVDWQGPEPKEKGRKTCYPSHEIERIEIKEIIKEIVRIAICYDDGSISSLNNEEECLKWMESKGEAVGSFDFNWKNEDIQDYIQLDDEKDLSDHIDELGLDDVDRDIANEDI